ncbi:hypothetical protein MASR2M79_08150 [Aminivibrio sp.]
MRPLGGQSGSGGWTSPVCLRRNGGSPWSIRITPSFREELQESLGRINREGMALIMVTHDFGEDLSLGSRVAVISEGALHQA